MNASISRFIQRTKPYRLAIALVCAFTAAIGVAWAQTRIDPSGVSVNGSVIGDDVLYSIGGGRAVSMGGAGNMQHFADVFTTGKADAGLAASIFHFGEIAIPDLKNFLRAKSITVR